jgi:hypothetical protein
MSDELHYLFDFGRDESTDRFSIFKDGKGYLNFEVFDSGAYRKGKKSSYKVSADISNWKAGLLGSEYELLSTANTTSDLTEGSNLYYTSARAQSDALVVAANRALSNLSSVAINTSLLLVQTELVAILERLVQVDPLIFML